MKDAALLALTIADTLSHSGISGKLYGDASPEQIPLAKLRRMLGYFGNGGSSRWQYNGEYQGPPKPDFGPGPIACNKGPVLLGVTPWVLSCNAVLDIADIHLARQIARGVSEKGGGLLGVEAMALAYGIARTEVAMNLKNGAPLPGKVIEGIRELVK